MTQLTPPALITGAGGWLGSRLAEVLIHGLPEIDSLAVPQDRLIRCLVRNEAEAVPLRAMGGRIELVFGDVTDPASLPPFFSGAEGATLFHVAGVVHPTRGVRELIEVNAGGTKNLIDAAERAGLRRFIAISSNSPMGVNPTRDHLFDESAPYNPYMTYGRSKVMMEGHVNAARDRGRIETVILRPPWFYGPRQPARQSLFFTMVKQGKAPIVGDGDNRRSMAYVDNSCQGMLLAERVPGAAGQTYWIADRRPYTMNEIVDTIERLLETDFGMTCAHKRMRLPGLASEVAWIIDKAMQSVGLYHQKIHVLSEMNRTIACSVAKAERELGYNPAIELEEGMRRSIRWCLDNGQSI